MLAGEGPVQVYHGASLEVAGYPEMRWFMPLEGNWVQVAHFPVHVSPPIHVYSPVSACIRMLPAAQENTHTHTKISHRLR